MAAVRLPEVLAIGLLLLCLRVVFAARERLGPVVEQPTWPGIATTATGRALLNKSGNDLPFCDEDQEVERKGRGVSDVDCVPRHDHDHDEFHERRDVHDHRDEDDDEHDGDHHEDGDHNEHFQVHKHLEEEHGHRDREIDGVTIGFLSFLGDEEPMGHALEVLGVEENGTLSQADVMRLVMAVR